MIIRRAFYRETIQSSLAVAIVLVVLFVFLGLSKLLGHVALGKESRDLVLYLLAFELLKRLDVLMPLALFVGVILTLGRWYRDSEMVVLAVCGVGLASLVRPAMVVATIVALVIAAISLYFSPLTAGLISHIRQEAASRIEITGLSPGVFTELKPSGRIIFVERINKTESSIENIFASADRLGRKNILVAPKGYQFIAADTGARFLVIEDGVMYDGVPGEGEFQTARFERYTLNMTPLAAGEPSTTLDSTSSLILLSSANPREVAELHWRLAKPLSVFILVAFALILSHTDARRGRAANLIAAILVYFTYSNLLGVGETLLKSGDVPAYLGLWWVHAGFALIAGYFLVRRTHNKPLIPLPSWASR